MIMTYNFISFQDMTAFTPPPESWIRHPQDRKKDNHQQQQQQAHTSKEGSIFVPGANQLEKSCKSYIESAEISIKSHKSLGTDDHFKSMVCSKNLLKVCEKLMTNKKEPTSTSNSSINMFDGDDDFDAELSLMNEKSRMEYYRSKYGNRRDSQSLPASPKMERKNTSSATPVGYNPYFTIAKTSEARPESSISFLTNLFGITARKPADIPSSTVMTQKTDTNHNLVEQKTNLEPTFSGANDGTQEKPKPKLVPQPHEYREMNFWSPTSM